MKFLLPILIYFLIFASVFVFLVPPFEANDEPDHLNYINFVAKNKSLPVQTIDSLRVEKEGHQFPLYYMLSAGIEYLFQSSSVSYRVIPNKNNINYGGTENLVPVYNHVSNEVFASDKDKHMFYALRFFQVLFSLLNLFFIYKVSEFYFADSKGKLLTVFIAGAIPQYVFVSSYINNDTLANLISTLLVFSFLRFVNMKTIGSIIFFSIILSVGLIAKKTIFFFIPVIIITLLIMLFRKKIDLKILVWFAITTIFSFLIFASWFYLRNINLYSDIFLSGIEMQTVPYYVDMKSILSFYFLYPFIPGLFGSFWGVFGWMNVALPFFVYVLLFLLCACITLFTLKKINSSIILNEKTILSLLSIVFCVGGIVYYNLSYSQHQGRFLFPVISFISIFLVYGIKAIAERFNNEKMIYIFAICFFVLMDIISIVTLQKFYYD